MGTLRSHTPLCDLLGIRHPIVLAGMAGGPSTAELVAAVSEAGGLGTLGAAQNPPDELRALIRRIRELTDRPFGVNLLLAGRGPGGDDVAAVQRFLDGYRAELGLPPGGAELRPPAPMREAQLEVIFSERVPVFSVGLGDPGELTAAAHEAGALVTAMVSTVAEAVRVARGGVDVVVAQGADAGGHRSTFEVGREREVPLVGTMALVPQVVDAVSVPVLAAGGIADGRGIAAALALGAAGAQLGTRFLVARECGIPEAYKEALLRATETDTVVTTALTGRPARSVRNRLIEELERGGPEPLGYPLQAFAASDVYEAARGRGDAGLFPLLAGQGLRLLKREQGAAEIVAELAAEAEAALARLAGS